MRFAMPIDIAYCIALILRDVLRDIASDEDSPICDIADDLLSTVKRFLTQCDDLN